MNILFLSLVDFNTIEEKGIYTDLLREFDKNEHELFIVSPTEKKINHYNNFNNGKVKIIKPRIKDIQKSNVIKKGISILILQSKFKKYIKEYFKNIKFDLILYSTPPITFNKIIKYLKVRDDAKTYLLLKDIFPQNALDLGILKKSGFKGIIYKYFKNEEKKLYWISDYIGCMSEANVEYLVKKNKYLDIKNIEVCPNSIEIISESIKIEKKVRLRVKYNLPLDKYIFVYGGNLGKPQGVDFLIQCVKENEKNHTSFILVIGSGTEFDKIKKFYDENHIHNSKLIFQLPKDEYENLVKSCDVGLIFLDKRFTIPNFPSRILSYMQAKMPILAATDINTDLGKIITEGKFGYWCESDKVEEFNKLINIMCDTELTNKLGKVAFKYLNENYTVKKTYEIIMNHFKA
jgi:hypothetical protein